MSGLLHSQPRVKERGKSMKKTYSSPELEKLLMSAEDILEGSGETAERENLFDTSELF